MDQPVAVGIDGGASRLKWSVRDRSGLIHHGQTLGANLQILGWERYLERITQAVREALATAGAAPGHVGSIGLGLSGVDRPIEKLRLSQWVRASFPALQSSWVGNDALPALRQGAGKLAGIILIAGTGSICLGAAPDGRTIRVGGWGAALGGDEGSGFWIGRTALNVACQLADGRRRGQTRLLGEVLATLNLIEPIQLIPWATSQDADQFKRTLAGLTPLVLDLARQDDPAARRIVRLAQAHLAAHVLTAARRLDQLEMETPAPKSAAPTPQEPRVVVCAGGVFDYGPEFLSALDSRLGAGGARLQVTQLQEPASLGALALGEESRSG